MQTNRIKKINILALLIYLICLFLIYNVFYCHKLNLNIGEVATENIISKETFENKEATLAKREQAKNNISNIYQVLPSVQIETKNSLNELSQSIMDLKYTRGMTQDEKLRYLKSNSPYLLKEKSFKYLLSASNERIEQIFTTANDLLSVSFSRGVKENQIDEEKEFLIASVEDLELNSSSKEILIEIINVALTPNEIIDLEKTEELKKEAANEVEPVMIEEGDIILLEGEVITEDKLDLLIRSGNEIRDNGGILLKYSPFIFILINTFLIVLYIYKFKENIYLSKRYYILLISNIIIILASIFLIKIDIILVPILLLGLVVSAYVDKELIIPNTLYISIFVYYFEGLSGADLVYMNLLGITLVNFSNKLEDENINFYTSISSVLLSAFIYSLIIINDIEVKDFFINMGFALGNGIFATIIAIGSGFLWENLFGLLTVNRLQELSDNNRPLLRQLVEEAPGTYQHSLMVSNLAESATKAIGGNYHLAKAGALYHDLGKAVSPEYFKENQFGIENPHNELAPIESANIIIGHVINGKAIAKKNKLPEELIRFIDEHHGDTLVNYFYYNAKLKDENTRREDFQYKGKKPQSIETAVVMICDSCEAAVRSIKNKTEENIEKMVDDVIDGKIKDRQFTECDISFSDIDKIKKDLYSNFKSMYHERIEYPEDDDD